MGARRAGRGVYNVKIVETIRMFDFAIALIVYAPDFINESYNLMIKLCYRL